MSVPCSLPGFGHRGNDANTSFLSQQPNDPTVPGQSECCGDMDSELSPRTRFRLLTTLIMTLLAFEIGGKMIPGPMVRLIETIACDKYWRRHEPARLPAKGHLPEHLCKISAVQTEVATVKGYSDLFEALLCMSTLVWKQKKLMLTLSQVAFVLFRTGYWQTDMVVGEPSDSRFPDFCLMQSSPTPFCGSLVFCLSTLSGSPLSAGL
ncbi:hypothetical protein F1880_002190 [Penicillium rolfsii]|nr:hypothetical protein F1880_002190 [Penicillium rolfsii]